MITRFPEIARGAVFGNVQTQLLEHLAAICAGRDSPFIGLSDLSALHELLLAWFKERCSDVVRARKLTLRCPAAQRTDRQLHGP